MPAQIQLSMEKVTKQVQQKLHLDHIDPDINYFK